MGASPHSTLPVPKKITTPQENYNAPRSSGLMKTSWTIIKNTGWAWSSQLITLFLKLQLKRTWRNIKPPRWTFHEISNSGRTCFAQTGQKLFSEVWKAEKIRNKGWVFPRIQPYQSPRIRKQMNSKVKNTESTPWNLQFRLKIRNERWCFIQTLKPPLTPSLQMLK